MRRAWRRFRWHLNLARLWAGLALVAYLVTAFGLPLPAHEPKDRSQPYPCQDHPCGCQSAEQCWRHCCCFTPEEKWAWAEAHGVVPPSYAERPSGEGWNTPRLREREESCTSCACGHAQEASHSEQDSSHARGVLGIAALRCRGLSTLWVSTGVVSPPPPASLRDFPPRASDWVHERTPATPGGRATPPDPPPRRTA
jgi:hypothetical protein